MLSIFRALFLFAFLSAPTFGSSARVILIVGDSLSAGYGLATEEAWVSLLQACLVRQGYDDRIVNASISGDTTRGGLSRLPRSLEIHDPWLVVIELGGNDGLRGIPINEIRQNLSEMIAKSRAAGAQVALLGIRIPPNYGFDYTEKFHNIYADLAEEYELPLVPFFLRDVALDPDLMQPDGIHPNARAQPRLRDHVWQMLEPLLTSD